MGRRNKSDFTCRTAGEQRELVCVRVMFMWMCIMCITDRMEGKAGQGM